MFLKLAEIFKKYFSKRNEFVKENDSASFGIFGKYLFFVKIKILKVK